MVIMTELNPVARQPRRNHSLVNQRVSSLQTSPEQIRAPNNTQIENEEIVEVPKVRIGNSHYTNQNLTI